MVSESPGERGDELPSQPRARASRGTPSRRLLRHPSMVYRGDAGEFCSSLGRWPHPGAILDLLREWSPAPVVGYDIDPGRLNEARRRGHDAILADFLSLGGLLETVWIVGNPPFSLAQEFVEHALRIAPPGSRVTFLLRLAFLSSQGRAHLYSGSAGFRHLGVLGRRPSFTPGGGTDSSDYGWFTWEVGHRGPSMVDRLDSQRRMDND